MYVIFMAWFFFFQIHLCFYSLYLLKWQTLKLLRTFKHLVTLERTWSFDIWNSTGCNDPLSPSVPFTPNFIPSDSLTSLPFSLSLCGFQVRLHICKYSSLDVHLEQLLSCLLQLQIDRDRVVWARLAFCSHPLMCQFGPQPAGERSWTTSEWLNVCVYVLGLEHYRKIITLGSIVLQLLNKFTLHQINAEWSCHSDGKASMNSAVCCEQSQKGEHSYVRTTTCAAALISSMLVYIWQICHHYLNALFSWI